MFSEHWTEELKDVDTVPAVKSHETYCSWLLPLSLVHELNLHCSGRMRYVKVLNIYFYNIVPNCLGHKSVTMHLNLADIINP